MEEGCMGAKKCGRWNPTGEQVKVLTELFRAGLRTPTTDQIQKISAQLSFYGKIESKNVFYWFQNHKARERHKRRRLKPPSNYVCEKNEACNESERVIETLQLFPLRPFEEYHHTQLRNLTKDSAYVPFSNHHPHPHLHPPLDLRLSSL